MADGCLSHDVFPAHAGMNRTNALGNVHNEVRHDLLVSDAMQIAGTVSRQILAPLAILNTGVTDTRLMPWFRFDTREAEDLSIYADALPKLATVMQIPTKWAHDKLKIPLPEKGEDVLQVRGEGDKNNASLAMLTANGEMTGYADQTAIDAIHIPAETLQTDMERILAPLLDEVKGGIEPSELLARLGELYPKMDDSQLEELLARAFFVSDLWGRLSAEQEDHA